MAGFKKEKASGRATYPKLHDHDPLADYDADTRHASREQLVGVATLAGGGLFVACGVVRFLTLGDSGPGTALTLGPLGLDLHGRF